MEAPVHPTNKFLKEIWYAPRSNKHNLTLLWDLETNTFSTRSFHPTKVQHRITIHELDRVIKYLSLTPNYNVYNSLRWLILIPSLFLSLFLYLILKILPMRVGQDGKILMIIYGK